jgi:hypothetical protein
MLTTPIGTMPIEMIPRGAMPTASNLGLSPQFATPFSFSARGSVAGGRYRAGTMAGAGHPLVAHPVGPGAVEVQPGGLFRFRPGGVEGGYGPATGRGIGQRR